MFSIIKKYKKLFISILFVSLYSVVISYASPLVAPYAPGETLTPDCAPGEVNCTVTVPLSLSLTTTGSTGGATLTSNTNTLNIPTYTLSSLGGQPAFTSQIGNTFYAGPNGSSGLPIFRTIVAADIPILNQSTTGTASNITGTVAVINGGTGAMTLSGLLKGNNTGAITSAIPGIDYQVAGNYLTNLSTGVGLSSTGGLSPTLSIASGYYLPSISDQTNWNNNLLPTQTGNNGKFLFTNGSNFSWSDIFPSQIGNMGKILVTSGTNTSWSDYDTPINFGNASITHTGLPGVGVSVGGSTVTQFLQNYFFPPSVVNTSISANNMEMGSTSIPISWIVTKGTYAVSTIMLATSSGSFSSGTPIIATGNTQSGTAVGVPISNDPITYTLTTTPSIGSPVVSNTTINFYNKIYYGLSNIDSNISNAQILFLSGNILAVSRVMNSTSFSPSGQYVYFAWPESFETTNCAAVDISGVPISGPTVNCFYQGSAPITDFQVETKTFVNASGYSTTYKIYRSANLLYSTISYSIQ